MALCSSTGVGRIPPAVWVLGIETAGDRGGVALLGEDGAGYELSFDAGRVHAEMLGGATDALIRAVGIAPEDLGLVAVDVGPGSFTGIRIGMAFAAGTAQALSIPTVGVRQTEVVGVPAARVWAGSVMVWIHDRGEHVFAAWVSEGRIGTEAALPVDRALQRLVGKSRVLVVGSGALRFQERLAGLAPNVVTGLGYDHPVPLEVARLGLESMRRDGGVEAGQLEPHYVHPPLS